MSHECQNTKGVEIVVNVITTESYRTSILLTVNRIIVPHNFVKL